MFYICSMGKTSIPHHGRGAQSAAVPQRFGLAQRSADGDWRNSVNEIDGPPPKLRTTVTEEDPKSILSFNQSPDIAFDRSVNAYRGCEHEPSLFWLMIDRPLSGAARKTPNV